MRLGPEYTTSSEIYKITIGAQKTTVLKRLKKFQEEGIVHCQRKKNMLPGGDKLEWCLLPEGQSFLSNLFNNLKLGLTDSINKDLELEITSEIKEQLGEFVTKEMISQLSSRIMELVNNKIFEQLG